MLKAADRVNSNLVKLACLSYQARPIEYKGKSYQLPELLSVKA